LLKPESRARFADLAVQLYESANRRTVGWLAVLARAGIRFSHNRGSLAAAGITFFSIFSIFPLLFFTITTLNPLLDLPIVQDALRNWLATAFPIPLESLLDDVNALLTAQGSINLIALIGFLWAASGMFNTMLLSINYAWGIDNAQSRIQSRLLALVIVTAVAVLVVLLVILLWLLKLVAGLLLTFWESIGILSLPLLLQVLLIFALYKAGPATQVDGKAALLGALAASLAIELVTRVFAWYLNSEWSAYTLLYGSLGAIIGLLFWIYLSNLIVLFGAYLTEAIQARWSSAKPTEFRELITFELN
jgi:membrane protein